MLNRRSLLQASSFGFGMLALKGLMAEEIMKNNKRVIFMYMNLTPSLMEVVTWIFYLGIFLLIWTTWWDNS